MRDPFSPLKFYDYVKLGEGYTSIQVSASGWKRWSADPAYIIDPSDIWLFRTHRLDASKLFAAVKQRILEQELEKVEPSKKKFGFSAR